jgi:hypothetical protein
MRYFHYMRRQAARIGGMYRRLRGPLPSAERTTIYEDMETGAVTGFFACTALALYLAPGDLSAAILISLSFLGLFVGATIGAILWIGSAELPEDAVRAPAPGQGRSDSGRRR